jgi:hypothetical protein
VDAPTSTDCRIRISSFSGQVTDVSDGFFAIGPEGANALLYIGDGCRAGAPAEGATGAALRVACLAALWVIARRRSRSRVAARCGGRGTCDRADACRTLV